MLRFGGHLVAAGDFANDQSVPGLRVLRHQLIQQPFDLVDRLLQRGGHLLRRKRLVRDVDNRFQDGLEMRLLLSGNGRTFFSKYFFHGLLKHACL